MTQVRAISPFLHGEGKQRPENPRKLMGQRMQPSIQQKKHYREALSQVKAEDEDNT